MSSKFHVRALAKEEFRDWDKLVSESQQGTLFHKSFWLEASNLPFVILGCFDSNDQILGGIPLPYQKKFGFTIVRHPSLTPYLGVVFRKNDSKYVKCISREKEIACCLAEKVREMAHFAYIGFSFDFVDIQPFIWQRYASRVRYTYVLELDNLEDAWQRMDAKRRNDITRAEKDGICVGDGDDFDCILALVDKTFARQGKKKKASRAVALRYNEVLSRKGRCKAFVARDKEGIAIATVYIAWDEKRSYYLLGGYDSENRHHGASAIAMWEAIRFTKEELGLNEFDFEGSMVPAIERFFRKFGGRITPHYVAIWCRTYIEPFWLGYELLSRRYR